MCEWIIQLSKSGALCEVVLNPIMSGTHDLLLVLFYGWQARVFLPNESTINMYNVIFQ
jgi:hypothetical protein